MYLKNYRIFIAISIMLDIAFHAGSSGIVNAVELAERTGFLKRGIEPLLQSLSRGGLLESIRGPKGGYRLARSEKVISLKDIVEAVQKGSVEAPSFQHSEKVENRLLVEKIVAPLWEESNKILEAHFAGISLEDLLEKAREEGLEIPSEGPIFFSI